MTIIEPFSKGRFVIRSSCGYITQKIKTSEIGDALSLLEINFEGKSKNVLMACERLNFIAKVVIHIEEKGDFQEFVLPSKSILFWSEFRVDIKIVYN